VPALAVLRSPLLVYRSMNWRRSAWLSRMKRFWTALERFQRDISNFKSQFKTSPIANVAEQAWPKVDAFLKSFGAWRRLARQGRFALSRNRAG